ncbi:HMG (high mobility group) box domain-containing protein [Ditylenchus destructor]|uniref:HMG (High mobility group) box domain-containing protein n=1 Tax=Ditylenchus destructor TaxID=166010 RepID=A0AAD4MK22_9BILA|nr:HMG (high mobility group) box domain-containing protein [Ditylenchus destructor]
MKKVCPINDLETIPKKYSPVGLCTVNNVVARNVKSALAQKLVDEEFVSLRLAINDCLNESVNLSFSRLTESNGNNDQDPPSIESSAMRLIGLASTAHQRPTPTQQNFSGTNKKKRQNPQTIADTHPDQSTEADVESIARRTTANSSMSNLRKPILDNFGLNDESNNRTELDESLLVPAYPLSNDDSIQKNNETIGPVSASNLFVVKDEPSLFDELADTVPASSDHSDKLIPGNTDSIDKSNERTQPDTASTLSLVKDEPSVFDELASNRREKLALGNSENLSEQNNDRNGTEHVNSVVVKDEPNLMEELTTAFPSSSNYNDSLIPSDTESTALSLKSKRSSKQNFSDLYAENIKSTQTQTSSNPPVVKDEPCLIDELAADIPGLSYYDDDLTPTTSENLSEQNNVRNGTEHVNSVLVKDEPNLMEELTTAFPSSSNYNDSLVPSNTGSAAPSLKPKRSRKQNFSDLNIKSTQPQTSSSLPVVKEEPSLIDELAANIPGPSNYRISPSNNANSTDSDDEIRIFTEPPAPKRPRSRNRLGIYESKGCKFSYTTVVLKMPKIRNADDATVVVSKGISNGSMWNLSGYRLFAKENRGAVQSVKPGCHPHEIMRQMGRTWSKLPEAEKKKWNDMAAKFKGDHFFEEF